jgi:hypothetical protein
VQLYAEKKYVDQAPDGVPQPASDAVAQVTNRSKIEFAMTIFSFCAERFLEVQRLKGAFVVSGLAVQQWTQLKKFDDSVVVHAEFESTESLDSLRRATHLVIDGRLMRQTLRACPLDENDFGCSDIL